MITQAERDFDGKRFGQPQDMTLRDYFAAKVLQGIWANSEVDGTYEMFAQTAYKQADAMIKVRSE